MCMGKTICSVYTKNNDITATKLICFTDSSVTRCQLWYVMLFHRLFGSQHLKTAWQSIFKGFEVHTAAKNLKTRKR
jgi:hypothetical protein